MLRTFLRRLRRRTGDSSGTNLLEAAILAPLLLLLTLGIVEFSTLLYVYLALENGVSQASRFGVTGNALPSLSREDSIKEVMRQATPTLTLNDGAFSFSHLSPGGGWAGGAGGSDDVEKVTVDYTWDVMTPVLRPFFTNGQIHFTVSSSMKNERRFQ